MTRFERLTHYWVYGALPISLIILALLIVHRGDFTLLQFLLALHLPIYMLHQYEEHDDNRFKKYMDREFGADALSQTAVFVINVVGVWFLFALLIFLSLQVSVGLGLGVVYLTNLNGITHLIAFAVTRRYNPGLITAALLFIPLTVATLKLISNTNQVSTLSIVLGVIIGVGIHVAIVLHARKRRAKLP